MIKVTLKDKSEREYEQGVTVYEIAKSISQKLAKEALVGKVNGKLVDLNYEIYEDAEVEIITFDDPLGQEVYRHSTAHIMAMAVQRLFPGTKLAIGPAIKDGFYYDFDSDHKFTPEDLEKIEEEMKKIIKEDIPFKRIELSYDEAVDVFKERNETYKLELIEELKNEKLSCYSIDKWVDLCSGPHVQSTGKIKAVKLTGLAGAYWRGDEKNKMLQRIYGTSFPKKSVLDEYLHRIEEAKKRDHRKIGKELELFGVMDEGPGFPFFYPKGMVIRNELESFWREEHVKRGYQEIRTPIMLSRELWERSGHWEHYKENMYFTKIDESDFAIKPMNCPGSILVYKSKVHSYRELPIRMCELGLVHRHELSGTLHGLMRVRCFTQDDAHIFMLPSQIKEEIIGVIELFDYFYNIFGLPYRIELSTKPEKAMGSDEIWELATNALREAIEAKGLGYSINEGDGAFYGPKIDFHLEDCLGRTWQCGTIQLDFLMPEKFDITYIGEDGKKHRPVMIHRVVFGSIERFIGILTEHFAGAFPVWLAPVQVALIPIADRHLEYVKRILKALEDQNVRAQIDDANEKMNYKIRKAQSQKIPYMLIAGDKEAKGNCISVRHRKHGDLGKMSIDEFCKKIKEEIDTKKLES
ncbi:MAG: threonine--tRNA ligase [Desulfotomaculum sp.]|nr:threonine--tRNA ligase [Desulfotomaculum sp.]